MIILYIRGNISEASIAATDRNIQLSNCKLVHNHSNTYAETSDDNYRKIVNWFFEQDEKEEYPIGTLLDWKRG